MKKIEFIKQKLEQLNLMQRELDLLEKGITESVKDIVDTNVDVGIMIRFEGMNYEIIDYRSPSVWGGSEYEDLKYELLCLKSKNGSVDNSDYGKRIRKDKFWHKWNYSNKKQQELYKYHDNNTIRLTNHFYISQIGKQVKEND